MFLDSVDSVYSLHDEQAFDQEVLNINIDDLLNYKTVKKLHREMWHARSDQLSRWLIRKPWPEDKKKEARKLITKVINNCQVCKGIKQVHCRPKNIGLKAEYPNEIVVVDQAFLKDEESKNKYPFLHLMDVATRWSMAFTITGRGGNAGGYDVTKALYLWEQIWGSPPQILFSDRGREFINSRIYEYCIQRNVKQMTSPVRTPASNGLIERHNGILKNIAYKLARANRRNLEQKYIDFEDILFSAAAAKNSMVGKLGYSSQYLAFLNNHLCFAQVSPDRTIPAISSEINQNKLDAERQVLCRNNLRNEALRIVHDKLHKDELNKILKERLRPIPEPLPDDSLHDEPNTGRGWIGPCTVIRHNDKMVYLREPGGGLKTVHRHRVKPRMNEGKIEVDVIPVDEEVLKQVSSEEPLEEEVDYRTTFKKESESAFQHNETDIDEYIPYEPSNGFDGEEEVVDEKERCVSVDRNCEQTEPEGSRLQENAKAKSSAKAKKVPKKRGRPPKQQKLDVKSMTEILEKHVNKEKTVPVRTSKHELSRLLKDARKDDVAPIGKGVLTRAQKRKLMNMFVVEYTSADSSYDIFVTKDDLRLKECVDGPEFNQPKIDEWAAWQRNDSFEWVKDEGQPRVRCMWVLTKRRVFTKQQLIRLLRKEIKIDDVPLVVKVKARLTPQGTVNQDPDRHNIECESPTADRIRIRMLL